MNRFLTILGKYFPRLLVNVIYYHNFHRFINWNNPTEFNEKIIWMQFNTDTSKWSLYADKYRVKEVLASLGYGEHVVKTYGAWTDAENINFEDLPDSFVLKTNHGYGDVFVIKNKNDYDINLLRNKIQTYLKRPFGFSTVEPHYLKIKPFIIAEELLNFDINVSSSIVDYKFYCFSGEPEICGVYYDRDPNTHKTNSTFYDINWNRCDFYKKANIGKISKDFDRPKNFDKMIQLCRELTVDFPFVRLDLYESDGNVYIGEFTFTPAACRGGSINNEIFAKWGDLIKLPQK